MRALLSFPNPVNEKAARVVAGCVLLVSIVALGTGAYWLLPVMAAGFALRVASGPRLSPLGLFATKVLAPRLGPAKLVPGPPKRFAQAVGLVVTTAGALVAFPAGSDVGADALLGVMVLAAGLESLAGYCLGCQAFALLMRAGVIPETVCLECADIRRRPGIARP